ncbi:hypothetical protein INT43_009086 [Umbelopsis isabellina]|uniref:Geranylgeranyl transferase type-2 subunit alpha n=1 Tax=Mortierella isabellina TaxID=91625 RepID=A0A8H7U7G2_MORIS|nr:hypothetical protein INT43_009086 [Umbelopsis isabellina]
MSSNVHGVKKVKTSEEIAQARKEKEAVKIKEYNGLVSKCRREVENKNFDNTTLKLTSQILQYNPDFYTIWNYRREILLNGIFLEMTEEEKEATLKQELGFFMELIRINPKSYWLWNHRRWCLATMAKPDWKQELKLVGKMLDLDARNFHGWGYRRYVIDEMTRGQVDTQELDKSEYEYTSTKIKQSFSNYSAWHYRSKLLPSIIKDITTEERKAIGKSEIDMIKNALYTEPDDQSAWLYYWWLVGRVPKDVKLLGAYTVPDKTSIFLVFDDEVLLARDINVQDASGQKISGHWFGVASTTAKQPSCVWALNANTVGEQKWKDVCLTAEDILLDSPEKRFCVPSEAIQIKETADKDVIALVRQLEACPDDKTVSVCKLTSKREEESNSIWQVEDHESLLLNEIESLEELLELEPDSKWLLQTMAHFLLQLDLLRRQQGSTVEVESDIRSRALKIIRQLSSIDPDRSQRYIDWEHNVTKAPLNSGLDEINGQLRSSIQEHLDRK